MSEADPASAVLRNAEAIHAELVELRAAFLVNTSKLAKICAAFGVSAALPDTETHPEFSDELIRVAGEKKAIYRAYNELIFAVARKFEGETRHQAALRYIMEAEIPTGGPDSAFAPFPAMTPKVAAPNSPPNGLKAGPGVRRGGD